MKWYLSFLGFAPEEMGKIIDLRTLLTYAEIRNQANSSYSVQAESAIILNGLSRSLYSLRTLNVRLSAKLSILLTIDLHLISQQMQQFPKERAKGNFQSCCKCSYRLGLLQLSCHVTAV